MERMLIGRGIFLRDEFGRNVELWAGWPHREEVSVEPLDSSAWIGAWHFAPSAKDACLSNLEKLIELWLGPYSG